MENKNEIWKDCKGYEGLYQISSFGRVWSVRRQQLLKAQVCGRGYLGVILTAKNGKIKRELVHRLVALAFIPNPEGKPQVNHIDEDKTNNTIDNLEWMTAAENNNYGSRTNRAVINNKQSKKVLCVETNIIYPSTGEAGRATGIAQPNISKVCLGQRNTAGGYHWRYIE